MFFKRLFSSSNLKLEFNDGGRAAAGYKGQAGDCVVRSIAIVTGLPYQKVYNQLFKANEYKAKAPNQQWSSLSNTHGCESQI